MLKLTKRKGFNFFRSYYDVYNELETEKDKVAFIEALLDRQFLGIKPTTLTGMAKFAYISQTNSIDSQVKGYEDKTKTILYPSQGGSVGGLVTPCLQVEVKEKEKVEVKEKDNINNIPEIKNFVDGDLDKNLIHANVLKFESPSWLESVSMQQKIKITEIQFEIDNFVLFLKTTQTQHKTKKAFLEHFINWLTKKLNSEKNGKQQLTNTGTKKQFRFNTVDALETLARQNK